MGARWARWPPCREVPRSAAMAGGGGSLWCCGARRWVHVDPRGGDPPIPPWYARTVRKWLETAKRWVRWQPTLRSGAGRRWIRPATRLIVWSGSKVRSGGGPATIPPCCARSPGRSSVSGIRWDHVGYLEQPTLPAIPGRSHPAGGSRRVPSTNPPPDFS